MAVFSSWLCSNGAKAKAELVRIVHPGGRIELHDGPVRAADVMLRNPNFCIIRSQASSHQPWSILSPDTTLMVGGKYYLFPENGVGNHLKRPTPRPPRVGSSEKENGGVDSACFNGVNCIMCLVDWIKIRKGNEKGDRIVGSEIRTISCRTEELEGKGVRRRGVFSENENIRGSPNRQFGSSSDNWQPSLNSITEEY